MKKKHLLGFIFLSFLLASVASVNANEPPRRRPYTANLDQKKDKTPLVPFGFRVGYNFPIERLYSNTDKLERLFSAEFGGFVHLGKIIYAEIGFGYGFHKGHYHSMVLGNPIKRDVVEIRYLQIPVKTVGYIPAAKKFTIIPAVGILYQPVLQVSNNYIGYSANNITQHQLLWTVSLAMKLYFVYTEIAYKDSITPFFSNKKSAKPNFLTVSLGFAF